MSQNMVIDHLQLGLSAVLGALCVLGWRAERSRAKAWEVDTSGKVPPSVKRFRALGEGEWIVVGVSEETEEQLSASPTLVASAFQLRDDDGNVESVAAGTKIEIRAIDGARRVRVDAITSGGSVRSRYSFEVRADLPLFTRAATFGGGMIPYRGHARPALAKTELVLAGSAEAVAGPIFPGCWLIVLFLLVGGGVVASLAGSTVIAWALLGVAVLSMGLGAMALPSKPSGSSLPAG